MSPRVHRLRENATFSPRLRQASLSPFHQVTGCDRASFTFARSAGARGHAGTKRWHCRMTCDRICENQPHCTHYLNQDSIMNDVIEVWSRSGENLEVITRIVLEIQSLEEQRVS